jgi:hypothetical protein
MKFSAQTMMRRSKLVGGPVAVWLLVLLLPADSLGWQSRTSKDEPEQCTTYSVRRIEIVGITHTSDEAIMRKVAFRIGKVFSERDIERTIKKLNRWGELEGVVREDISIKHGLDDPETPGWRCFADVLIQVREKK